MPTFPPAPPFDYNGCAARAIALTKNCGDYCYNQAMATTNNCPLGTAAFYPCSQQALNQQDNCNNNCKVNHINYINNCNARIWP